MAALIGLVIGALVGNAVFGQWGATLFGLLGFVAGVMWTSRRERAAHRRPEGAATGPGVWVVERIAGLEQRVGDLERALRAHGIALPQNAAATAPSPASPAAVHDAAEAVPAAESSLGSAAASFTPAATPVAPEPAALAAGADGTLQPVLAEGRDGDEAVPPALPFEPVPVNPVWAWIVGGNTLARLGVLLLFIGVGFLLKYAAEHVHVPISVRLAGVAVGGIALLAAGWRLRHARRAYAMVLQGGGVGILYLTAFAALRLYALLPPVAVFALMVWLCATSSWLAVRQDAISLAALAVLGGFLAPILTSSQSGSHVVLFSYYALLNAGILGIAWFKAWRSLNLLGFAFTFLVATIWGVTRYRPELFATTEPFLVLFFLFYFAVAVLYAWRRSVTLSDYVDAGLVFGTPLVVAGLQSALVRDIEYAMAYSALAMSAFYLAAGGILWRRRRDDLRRLVESFLALGVVFATLAVPLGLDARWTASAWAIEGAAILWAGLRQGRRLMRACGLLLQVAAGIAFALGLSLWTPATAPANVAVLNSACVGALLVALAGLWSAWSMDQAAERLPAVERNIVALVFAWGAGWWLFAGLNEIDRWIAFEAQAPAAVALLTATAVAFALAEGPLQWQRARVPALLLIPALVVVAALGIAGPRVHDAHLFAHGGVYAWIAAVVAAAALLRAFDRRAIVAWDGIAASLDGWHAGLFWLVLLLAAHELAWLGSDVGEVWAVAPWGAVPALGVAAVCMLADGTSWPVGRHPRGYLVVGATPVVAWLVVWSFAANVGLDGEPAPLPYVPLANPLDLAQALALGAVALWLLRVRRAAPALLAALPSSAVAGILAALVFAWINAIALRTIHFGFDVPYTPHALWRSTLVQATLSLLWSALALATMLFAHRRQSRAPWLAGATLLGVVVVKLFLVELAQSGTVTRIVSFIGVGLLLLLIGYLAPVPPVRKENAS